MNKKYLPLLIFLFFPALLSAQTTLTGADSARLVIDSALRYAKVNSLYADKTNWPALTDSVKKRALNAVSIQEALPALQLMFQTLGDYHGGAYYHNKNYRGTFDHKQVDQKLYADILNRIWKKTSHINSRVIETGYGYLNIPSNNPTRTGESLELAGQLQDTLMKLNPDKLRGLIIDLRTNTGGDMAPMLLGVGNLFTQGKLGSFKYPGGKPEDAWKIFGNAYYVFGEKALELPVLGRFNSKLKIVLLTSPYTASSAEALLISFKGQKNVRIIGEPTGGFTTANDSYTYLGVQIFMATAVEADRNGNIYYDNVIPDEEVITGDNLDDLSADKKIAAGLKWLKHN